MTRVVVLGARGMLGTDIVATAPDEYRVDAYGHSDGDITDTHAIARILTAARPGVVINATAYTQVDRAEQDYDAAAEVNGSAVSRLGTLCADRGVRIVHFSTDYVFRGDARQPYSEGDPADPVNAYGRSKLAGEQALNASGAEPLILRTQWLYGLAGRSFPRTMWERAMRRLATRVVSDQFGRPTYTLDLARATWDLVRQGASGVFHVSNSGTDASWFDVASAVFQTAGAASLLSACTTADYPTPARRPAYSVMSTDKLARAGITLAPWQDALSRYLALLSAETP